MKKSVLNNLCMGLAFAVLSGPYANSQVSSFKAGIARVDITPSESLFMGGYDESGRPGPSQGHEGSQYARALVFDDGSNRLAFVEVDIVSFPPGDYDGIRKLISNDTGIPFDHILLGCVHNHAAPYPGEKNANSAWNKNLDSNISKAVKDAISDLEPVLIGGGSGKSYIGMNRRKRMTDTLSYTTFDENNSSQSYGKYKTDKPVLIREMDGVYRLGANPEGTIDEEAGILRIDKLNGHPKAVMINYACHGTSLGARNNIIRPEWNGHMLEYVENQFPGLTGIFVQGASGDINPRVVGGLDGYKDNLETTKALGAEIGKEVVRVMNEIKTEAPVGVKINLVSSEITCPKKYGEVVKDFRHTTVDVPVTAIRISGFTWVTFPGEMFHEIGQAIKRSTHSLHPFMMGYCNGSLGYLPTREAYAEGGYEPWSSQFDPATEKILLAGIDKLLMKLY